MLTRIRTRLAEFRKGAGPIASMADFGLWSLRNALPPGRPKFWIVLSVIALGVIAAILLPGLRALFIGLTVAFAGLVVLMLVLSYVRTILSAHESVTQKATHHVSRQVVRAQTEVKALTRLSALNHAAVSDEPGPALDTDEIERIAARAALTSLLDSDIMDALVRELDDLRAAVATLSRAEPVLDKTVAQLRAEVNALSRQLDRRLRVGEDTLTRLSDVIVSGPPAEPVDRVDEAG